MRHETISEQLEQNAITREVAREVAEAVAAVREECALKLEALAAQCHRLNHSRRQAFLDAAADIRSEGNAP